MYWMFSYSLTEKKKSNMVLERVTDTAGREPELSEIGHTRFQWASTYKAI